MRSLEHSEETSSASKNISFVNFSLFFWVIFAFLDPDPDCESVSGSRDPVESGSNHMLICYAMGEGQEGQQGLKA
jgi:hypothetical protein